MHDLPLSRVQLTSHGSGRSGSSWATPVPVTLTPPSVPVTITCSVTFAAPLSVPRPRASRAEDDGATKSTRDMSISVAATLRIVERVVAEDGGICAPVCQRLTLSDDGTVTRVCQLQRAKDFCSR